MGDQVAVKTVADKTEIEILQTSDAVLIKQLATHPEIFQHVSDDWFPDPARWQPVVNDQVVYLVAKDGHGFFGFGAFIPDTWSCWKAHIGFLKRAYGESAISSFKAMLDWMWQHTRAARIVGEIVDDNRKAIRFSMKAGFEQYGMNPKSRLKGGVLRDQVCLGISRP